MKVLTVVNLIAVYYKTSLKFGPTYYPSEKVKNTVPNVNLKYSKFLYELLSYGTPQCLQIERIVGSINMIVSKFYREL